MNGEELHFVESRLRSEHPTWSNTRVFEQAVVEAGAIGGFTRSPIKRGRHPALNEEFRKHGELEKAKKDEKLFDHIDRMKRIRKFMTENPGMTFDRAFILTCERESKQGTEQGV
jgi:hypothetical protein